MSNEEWFTCACHTEALHVAWFDDDGDDEIYLSIWADGKWAGKLPWRSRFRYAWAAVRGKPFRDHLVLHRGAADDLARTLLRTSPLAGNSSTARSWTSSSTSNATDIRLIG